ncbi:hypothetical protein GQ53DRAFT_421921 [Thozetella sp. PMI_491]|nr:hypothetical protein GQ53DRAFT_421921 [Thozetella sp. PMI_491]
MSESPPYTDGLFGIHRRYVKIPRDQLKLLDRPDAWRADGIANVPAQVLESLQHFHTPKPSQSSQRNISASRLGSSPPTSNPSCQSDDDEPGTPEETRSPGGSDSESPKSGVSWSQSPEHHRRPLAVPDPPQESSPTRMPLTSSRRSPKPLPKAVPPSRSFLNVFPSSSLGSEADMEIEPLQAMPYTSERINQASRAAPPQPTPPSAQIPIISSTYTLDGATPEPPLKRARRMKPPPFGNSQPSGIEPPTTPALGPSMQYEPGQSSSSRPSTTSTATSHGQGQASLVAPSPLSAVATLQPAEDAHIALDLVHRPGETSQESPPTLSKIPPNGPASQVPFTAFKIAYPNFPGTQTDFIRACLCLEDLRKRKALPEFLYDDFIRVFCGPYIQYIEHLIGNPREKAPLTAIHWYNDNVTKPDYDKGVISKASLRNVSQSYPDSVRDILGGITGQGETAAKATQSQGAATQNKPAQESSTPDSTPFAFKGPSSKPQSGYSRHTQDGQDRITGELLSDPISTVDPSQPRLRQSLRPISPPHRSSSGVDRADRLTSSTPEVSRRKSRVSEIKVDTDLPDSPALSSFPQIVMQTQADAEEPRRRTMSDEAPPSTATSTVVSVPETAIKPKPSPHIISRSVSDGSPLVPRKPRSEKRKRDSLQWAKFLDRRLSEKKDGSEA